jgi:DUF1680 family protein
MKRKEFLLLTILFVLQVTIISAQVSGLQETAFTSSIGPAPGRFPVSDLVGGPMGIERIAPSIGTPPAYSSVKIDEGEIFWLQIDLGKSFSIDLIKLYPIWNDEIFWWDNQPKAYHPGFPLRFRIEAGDDAAFSNPALIAEQTDNDYIAEYPLKIAGFSPKKPVSGRYIRLTVSSPNQVHLWRFEVISGGKDVAESKTLSDSQKGDLGKHYLLRPQRPDGEGVVTDKPGQVTAPETWNPVKTPLRTPREGVIVGGLLGQTFERNISYLLSSHSTFDIVHNFLERAGKNPRPRDRHFSPTDYWNSLLGGSNAGRFLMGAGNTLRWKEDVELRRRMDSIIYVIEECTTPDGYIYGFPERRILTTEGNSYCRSWLTQGLVEAGIAGNEKAWTLLRRGGDWFNTNPYLPEMLKRVRIGNQGMIANSRTYTDTPIGVPGDIQVLQRYFQLNFWLDDLAARKAEAVWQYPYERTHSYLIVTLNAYMDMYVATGDKHYLEAMRGAWDIFHDHFLHTGGSISLLESFKFPPISYPPDSHHLRLNTGELCGNSFWATFNEQLRILFPEEEKYVAEIEKSIYNVGIANQESNGHIRYHAHLLGHKENGGNVNTCCEGQAARWFAALPEFIYKIADDGLYVDLYNESSITWKQDDKSLSVHLHSEFPENPEVKLHFSLSQNTKSKIRVRVPSWASKEMNILVNGKKAASGKPGTYVTIDRTWKNNDLISFTLPIEFRLTKYSGVTEDFKGKESYALEYGPVLMALTNENIKNGVANFAFPASELKAKLKPVTGKPLHFTIDGEDKSLEYMAYYQIDDEQFTCYPFFK